MTRVVWSAVGAAVLFSATSANAQLATRQEQSVPWLQVTPVIGQAPQFKRQERWNVSSGSNVGTAAIETRFAAGTAVGGVIEVSLSRRFGLVGSGLYVARRSTIDFETSAVDPGSNFLLAKAGLALRLFEPISELQLRHLTASIFAAPALVREMPKVDEELDPVFSKDINHYGLNLGVETEIPLGPDFLALQLAAEDFVVWWNEKELATRFDSATGSVGTATSSSVDTDPSHMWVFRAGLTFRVR